LFRRLSDFFIYLQYQAYQQPKNDSFNKKSRKQWHQKYKKYIDEQKQSLDNVYFEQQYKRWFLGYLVEDNFHIANAINNLLIDIQMQLRWHYNEKNKLPNSLNELQLRPFPKMVKSVELNSQGELLIQFNQQEKLLANKNLLFAFVPQTRKLRKNRRPYLAFLRIGGDVDEPYLLSSSMFRLWAMDEAMGR